MENVKTVKSINKTVYKRIENRPCINLVSTVYICVCGGLNILCLGNSTIRRMALLESCSLVGGSMCHCGGVL